MTLYLECKPDETLAVSLGVSKRDITHTNGSGRVCKKLESANGVYGMVDEDPQSAQPTYLKQLPNAEKNHDIKLLSDPTRNNHLIVICPKLEDWIIATAKTSTITLKSYNMSDIPRNLHSEINQRLNNLQTLTDDLLNMQNQRILYLQSLLKPFSC